ncbi:uncharacterized protein [Euwallacea fornicatus]|uniref:uncharacterized protein n=1 Tax=Euwallacea fornicatus TaxID=995702 RepID=UPI00338E4A37
MIFQEHFLAVAAVLLYIADKSSALHCWKCASNTDATCRDFFNTTRILLNQRHMDQYYSYGNVIPAKTDPFLIQCDGMHTSTFGQFKNVCLKKVLTVPHGPNEVVRECRMVVKDLKIGACPEDIIGSSPRNLEYCGTCEYDGCNSASSSSFMFVGLVPAVLLILGK